MGMAIRLPSWTPRSSFDFSAATKGMESPRQAANLRMPSVSRAETQADQLNEFFMCMQCGLGACDLALGEPIFHFNPGKPDQFSGQLEVRKTPGHEVIYRSGADPEVGCQLPPG